MERSTTRVIKFTEHITGGGDFTKSGILDVLKLIDDSDRNLNVYRGMLALFSFSRFNEFAEPSLEKLKADDTFWKCISLLKGDTSLPPEEVGAMLSRILNLPETDGRYRDVLMGCLYGSLWALMNAPENFQTAIDYGTALVMAAFAMDDFGVLQKLKLAASDAKVISMAGSGKKEIKLLNISSMAATVIAAAGKKLGQNIVVAKTVARATSSTTGSCDIFELAGVNLNTPIDQMAQIALAAKLGIFDINAVVPRLNRVYDNRLHNVQAFAGLVGGAAIANPIDAELINYGLTRGSTRLCSSVLHRLYPGKNILVIQGKDPNGMPVIDQVSVSGKTELAQIIHGEVSVREIAPNDFGFDFRASGCIETTRSPEENLNEFIKLLMGRGTRELKEAVAIEASLNLFGLEVVDDLKAGAELALDIIDSGTAMKVLEDLVLHSGGDMQKFKSLVTINSSF